MIGKSALQPARPCQRPVDETVPATLVCLKPTHINHNYMNLESHARPVRNGQIPLNPLTRCVSVVFLDALEVFCVTARYAPHSARWRSAGGTWFPPNMNRIGDEGGQAAWVRGTGLQDFDSQPSEGKNFSFQLIRGQSGRLGFISFANTQVLAPSVQT